MVTEIIEIIGKREVHYPSMHVNYVTLVVVLVNRGDSVSALIGEGPDEWIARNGENLSLCEAKGHFPMLEEKLIQRNWTFQDRTPDELTPDESE